MTFVHVPIDTVQGVNKGFGFVHFNDKSAADDAVEDHRRPKLDNKVIHVKHAGDRKVELPHKK